MWDAAGRHELYRRLLATVVSPCRRFHGNTYWSFSTANNYKYVWIHNTSGATQTYTIRQYMVAWNGMSSDTWGLAWSTF